MAIAVTFWFNNFATIERVPQICDSLGNEYFWSNPSNSQNDDTSYSFLTAPSTGPGEITGNTPYIVGFGISNPSVIPDAATINGLIIRINRGASPTSIPPLDPLEGGYLNVNDDLIQLFNNGVMIGDNKSTGSSWDTNWRYDSFGGENDTWGVSGGLTPNIIKNSGFGISLGADVDVKIFYDYRNYTAIDNFEVTVFYTVSEGGVFIEPSGIKSEENFTNLHQINRTIKPRLLKTEEFLPRHLRKTSSNITNNTLFDQEFFGTNRLNNKNTFIPRVLTSQEFLSTNNLETFGKIINNVLLSGERFSSNNKFFNLFYDKLTDIFVWNAQSDPGYFTWDTTYNLSDTNSKSIRRLTGSGILNKFATTAYPIPYFISDTLYFSGYIYITGSTNYAGLGFCIQPNLKDGYYAVIDTRNSITTSARSFRLFKSANNGTTITQLATYNQTGLIEQNKWYRIIIQVDSSGNMQANLYKDGNGSTLVSGTGATLSFKDNSSPYTSGYYGLTAFSTAAFDNLTNIQAKFLNTSTYGISSQENFNKPTLIPGPISISMANKGIVEEKVGQPRFSSVLGAISIQSSEILSFTNNLNTSAKIINNVLLSQERVSNELFLSKADIFTYNSFSFDGAQGTVTLAPGSLTIQHVGVRSQEEFKTNILKTSSIINSNILNSEEIFSSLNNLNYKVLSKSIVSDELSGINQIFTFNNINPVSIQDEKTSLNKFIFTISNLSISSDENILLHNLNYINNITNNLLLSEEKLGSHLIPGFNQIFPNTMQIEEKTGGQQLNKFTLIAPFILKTEEFLTKSNIRTVISQRVINPENNFGYHEFLKNTYVINPEILNPEEKLGINVFSFKIVPNIVDIFDVISNNTLNSEKTISPISIISSELLSNNYLNYSAKINTINFDVQDIFGTHSFTRQNLIISRSVKTEEKFDTNRILSSFNILPSLLNTDEQLGLNNFNRLINQNPLNFDEIFGNHNLNTFTVILPDSNIISNESSITSLIMFDPAKQTIFLNSRFPTLPGYSPAIVEGPIGQISATYINSIQPQTIEVDSKISNSALQVINNIRVDTIEPQDSFGNFVIKSEGAFIQPSSITISEISSNKLFSFWPISLNGIESEENINSNHSLYAFNYIYPNILGSEEFAGLFKHSIQPTNFPGKIHSWIESIYTIESDLDFRKTS